MNQVIDLLNSIYPLSPALQEHMNTILKEKTFQKKKYLLKSGHVCRNIYFIKKGLVRCFYTKHDQEVCSWFMKEGDLMISVESFFYQKESYESIQALEDCEFIVQTILTLTSYIKAFWNTILSEEF